MRVRSAQEAAERWSRIAPTRAEDYAAGVRDTSVDWAAATSAAQGAYADGVAEAVQRGAFARGVGATGNDGWRRRTIAVGPTRWGQGIREGTGDYQTGIAPYRDALERLALPPRQPRGDPRNLERAAVIARTLNEVRRRGAQ